MEKAKTKSKLFCCESQALSHNIVGHVLLCIELMKYSRNSSFGGHQAELAIQITPT